MISQEMIASAIVGALVAATFALLFKTIAFLYRKFFTKNASIEGDWFIYHPTMTKGSERIAIYSCKIRKGFLSKLVVKIKSKDNDKIQYQGKIKRERNYWIFYLNGKEHDESVYISLLDYIPTPDDNEPDFTYGLTICRDFDEKLLASPVVFAREDIESEVINMISNYFWLNTSKFMITTPKK